jgi:hypothetical protein
VNGFHDYLEITQYLVVPEPEHLKPRLTQNAIAGLISHSSLDVLTTIHLDNELRIETDEVEDVVSIRMLTSKLETINLSSAQMTPKVLLGFSHASAQNALQSPLTNRLVGLASHLP